MAEHKIVIEGITKRYPGVTVIDNLSLEIPERDFVTLLGPSGCGKTTTLRIIAGLEEPEEGDIWIDDRLVFSAKRGINVPAAERSVGLIFQSYALWPHMTVYQNVSFGLQGKMDKQAIKQRVAESLKQVYLEEYVGRYPSELSGGQQQRVAVARMLAAQPDILLMDEPLSNLDAKLRMQMRAELKRMHNDLDVTVVYVTHDQEEALTLSSKIAVMNKGIIEQYDPPKMVYKSPASRFVADFMGNPQMNFLEGTITADKAQKKVSFGEEESIFLDKNIPEGDYIIGVRPEDLSVNFEKTANAIEGKVYAALPAGSNVIIYIRAAGTELIVREERDIEVKIDQTVWVGVDERYINIYDLKTDKLVS